MSQAKAVRDDDMLPEYDFRGAERGRYFDRYTRESNVVVLAPDVAAAFPNAAAVNQALRLLVSVAKDNVRVNTRAPKPKRVSNVAARTPKPRR